MKTLILSQTRKAGVEWLTQNIAPTDQERRRTQTEVIYRNGDVTAVISKFEHLRSLGAPGQEDRAIVVGTVEENLVNQVLTLYRGHNINLPIQPQGGQVLTATEIKRRALIQQMEDLEREENLHNFFRNLQLEGLEITKTDINVGNRQFSALISGRFR